MFRRIASIVALLTFALSASFAVRAAHAALTPTTATVVWTAPGDDANTGTAFHYDVRVSTTAITAGNFANATVVTGAPAPQVAGTTQSVDLTGLSPATAYWCAIKTEDESGNWSAISNIVQFTTPAASDDVRPAALVLATGSTGASSVSLTWTATGDDSLTGTANHYEVRWSTAPINAANFSAATLVTSGVPVPAAPGTAQGCTVNGLDRSVDLHFAARVADEVNNWSALSNDLVVTRLLDAAPPAAPAGLTASLQDNSVHLTWTPNGEPDLAGYHVYRATSAGGAFTRIDASLLTSADFTDASAPDSASLWYAVSAVDASTNESAHSAAFRLWLHASGITAVHLQAVYPNPSSLADAVTLPLDVPASGPVNGRIDIVNSAGERIRTIVLSGVAPGTTPITWDGRNDAGRTTAPGVYRALLSAGGTQQVVRLVRR
jgi:chitodextrinase